MIIQYNQDGSVAFIIGSNIFRASNKVICIKKRVRTQILVFLFCFK